MPMKVLAVKIRKQFQVMDQTIEPKQYDEQTLDEIFFSGILLSYTSTLPIRWISFFW